MGEYSTRHHERVISLQTIPLTSIPRFSSFKTIIKNINHCLLKLSEGELIIELAITSFYNTLGFLKDEYSDTPNIYFSILQRIAQKAIPYFMLDNEVWE